jgi:hypothetical protein
MNRDVEDEAWDVVAEAQRTYLGDWNARAVRGTVADLKAAGLLIGSTTDEDDARLEEIRARDIQRRVAENKGIMAGMREKMNVAFLLDYIDKLERRNAE